MKKIVSGMVVLAALIFGFGGEPVSAEGVSRELAAKETKVAKAAKEAQLQIATKGDELLFNKKTLSAKAGAPVKLTFKNTATASSGLQHNWVLVQIGKETDVANAGIVAGPAKSYVPESPDVLVYTKLLNPGESDTITFKAPDKPGDYPYVCTFPGHALTMKGVLKVK